MIDKRVNSTNIAQLLILKPITIHETRPVTKSTCKNKLRLQEYCKDAGGYDKTKNM
jgi:hypothetical protein